MPAYNAAAYIEAALSSVQGQAVTDWELICVEDGSTDSTPELLSRFAAGDPRVTILQNPVNIGIPATLNRGMDAARGDYIARIDADDVWESQHLEKRLSYFARHPDVGFSAAWFKELNEDTGETRIRRPPTDDLSLKWTLLFNNPFCNSAVMFKRDIMLAGGCRYNESMRYSIDYDMWSQLAACTKVANTEDATAVYRVHGGGVTGRHSERQHLDACSVSRRQMRRFVTEREASDEELREACELMAMCYGPEMSLSTYREFRAATLVLKAASGFVRNYPATREARDKLEWLISELLQQVSRGTLLWAIRGGLFLECWHLAPKLVLGEVRHRLGRRLRESVST